MRRVREWMAGGRLPPGDFPWTLRARRKEPLAETSLTPTTVLMDASLMAQLCALDTAFQPPPYPLQSIEYHPLCLEHSSSGLIARCAIKQPCKLLVSPMPHNRLAQRPIFAVAHPKARYYFKTLALLED